MNRGRMLFGFGLALVVALFASAYVYRQLQSTQHAAAAQPVRQARIVVASGSVMLGQALAASDVTLMDWPEGKQPAGSLTRVDDAVGRAAITPLVAGQPILDQELAPRESGAGLPVAIPGGMRAVSVGVDDIIAVAGFVTPGTLVDVLVTGAGAAGPVTSTVLERVRVLAVGQQVQAVSGKPQTAPVVTLLVSPEDAEKLTLAAADGKIHLALRNTADRGEAVPSPVYASSIFAGTAPRALGSPPARTRMSPPIPPPFTVQVIRGDKVETQSFPR